MTVSELANHQQNPLNPCVFSHSLLRSALGAMRKVHLFNPVHSKRSQIFHSQGLKAVEPWQAANGRFLQLWSGPVVTEEEVFFCFFQAKGSAVREKQDTYTRVYSELYKSNLVVLPSPSLSLSLYIYTNYIYTRIRNIIIYNAST